MICVFSTDKVTVFDDVLPAEGFAQVWASVQKEEFSIDRTVAEHSLYWRHGDVLAASSAPCDYSQPNNGYRDTFKDACLKIANQLGVAYSSFLSSVQLYGRGTKLSWHRDSGGAGTFAYYVHPEWKPTWGGELYVPEQDVRPESNKDRKLTYGKEMWDDLSTGWGLWIAPKPNRLVYTAPDVLHQVNRVDPDAGDNLRVAVIGRLR